MVRGLCCRDAAHHKGISEETVAVGFLMRLILIVIVLAVAGGAIFLATWDMPAPTSRVEKVIPAERFK